MFRFTNNIIVRNQFAPCRNWKKSCTSKNEENQNLEQKSNSKEDKLLKKSNTVKRLNELLTSMSTDNESSTVKLINITTAKNKKQQFKKIIEDKKPKDLLEVTKNIANMCGENAHKTESELLTKLLKNNIQASDNNNNNNNIQELNLNELIVKMKVDRTNKRPEDIQTRAQFVHHTLETQKSSKRSTFMGNENKFKLSPKAYEKISSVNLYESEPLNIFKNVQELQESEDILKTWEIIEEKELQLAVTHPVTNYFQKMALWTKEGKIWKFPIHNEQGMEKENSVDFSEHIFLETHLDSWCPIKGPIRHFMELVCIGLSKNPYITVEEKRDHIMWFKEYFENKKELLQELIIQKTSDEGKQESIAQ